MREALEANGWQETDGADWQLQWSSAMPAAAQFESLAEDQCLNHLPGVGSLASKSGLAALSASVSRRLAARGVEPVLATPLTFLMPQDYDALQLFAHEHPEITWIQKPQASARGEGISLVDDVRWVETGHNWLAQEYLDSPHLIEGFKYTLRCYALITALDPLTLHVFDDGFTKLASRPFSTEPALRSDRFRHLTNPDVLARDPSVAVSERNLTRPAYRELLSAQGHDPDRLFAAISAMLTAVVAGARESLARAAWERGGRTGGCFELLGVDVLVDQRIRPWLLECNLSPSLSVEADAATDAARAEAALKRRLLASALEVIGAAGPTGNCGFERVLPAAAPPAALALPRTSELPAGQSAARQLRPAPDLHSWPLDGSLVLHRESSGEPHLLDPLAAYIWTAWSEGLAPEEIVEELVESFPEAAARAQADVWNALGQWVELGLAIPGAEPPEVSEPPAAGPVPLIVWNRQRVYRAIDSAVSVLAADPEAQRWIDAAMPCWDAGPAGDHAAAAIEVAGEDGSWTVIGPGARIPCVSLRQLGPCVRELVLAAGAQAAGGGVLRATIVGWSSGPLALLTGPSDARAELARACLADGGRCVADDLVAVTLDGEGRAVLEGHIVALEESVNPNWYGPMPGPDDEAGALVVTNRGAFSRYWRPGGDEPSPALVAPAVSIAVTPGPEGSLFAPLPVERARGLEDLLSATVAGARRISAPALAGMVGVISRTSCFRAQAGEPVRAAAVLREMLADVQVD